MTRIGRKTSLIIKHEAHGERSDGFPFKQVDSDDEGKREEGHDVEDYDSDGHRVVVGRVCLCHHQLIKNRNLLSNIIHRPMLPIYTRP